MNNNQACQVCTPTLCTDTKWSYPEAMIKRRWVALLTFSWKRKRQIVILFVNCIHSYVLFYIIIFSLWLTETAFDWRCPSVCSKSTERISSLIPISTLCHFKPNEQIDAVAETPLTFLYNRLKLRSSLWRILFYL